MTERRRRCCGYCGARNHTINNCTHDSEMINCFMTTTNSSPNFDYLSTRMIKRMATHYGYPSIMSRKQQTECLKQTWIGLYQQRNTEMEIETIADSDDETVSKNECPICYEVLEDKNVTVTNCNHKFCTECLITHARKSNDCPLCRSNLTREPKREQTPLLPNIPPTPHTPPHEPMMHVIMGRYEVDMERTQSFDFSQDFQNQMNPILVPETTIIDAEMLNQETQPEDFVHDNQMSSDNSQSRVFRQLYSSYEEDMYSESGFQTPPPQGMQFYIDTRRTPNVIETDNGYQGIPYENTYVDPSRMAIPETNTDDQTSLYNLIAQQPLAHQTPAARENSQGADQYLA